MKNRKIFIVCLLIVTCIICFCGVKLFYLNKYNTEEFDDAYANFLELYDGREYYAIENKILKDDYLSLLNLKLDNRFGEYILSVDSSDDNYIKYELFDENDKVISMISLLVMDSRYKSFDENDLSAENFVRENNLNNEVEFMDYVFKNKNENISIFSSVKDIKNNYIVKRTLAALGSDKTNKLIILTGKYDGYVVVIENNYSVYIEKGAKMYALSFVRAIDSEKELKNILNTIVIE